MFNLSNDNGIGAHSGAFSPNARFARYSLASLRQDQLSQEFQILGTFENFNFVGGVFYYHEEGDDDAWTPFTMQWNATGTVATRLPNFQAGIATAFPDRASTAKADSLAFFGQATWTPPILDERLHLTAGGRYTKDEKEGHLNKVNGLPPVLNGVSGPIEFKGEWSRFDPMVTAAFDITDDVNVYARWGTAYRAGGANGRSISYRAFDPETVDTIEGGIKAQFLDNRARLNLAAFKTKYEDIQIDFNAVNLGGTTRGTIETVNAQGRGEIEGFEADASFRPVDGVTLSISYAHTKGDLPPADNPFDVSTALVPTYIVFTPKNAWNVSYDYETPLPDGFGGAWFKFHIDASMADGYVSSSSVADLTDPSKVVNARVAITDIALTDAAKLELAIWSRNLLDEEHLFYRGGMSASFGRFGMFNDPRTYGLEATIKF